MIIEYKKIAFKVKLKNVYALSNGSPKYVRDN